METDLANCVAVQDVKSMHDRWSRLRYTEMRRLTTEQWGIDIPLQVRSKRDLVNFLVYDRFAGVGLTHAQLADIDYVSIWSRPVSKTWMTGQFSFSSTSFSFPEVDVAVRRLRHSLNPVCENFSSILIYGGQWWVRIALYDTVPVSTFQGVHLLDEFIRQDQKIFSTVPPVVYCILSPPHPYFFFSTITRPSVQSMILNALGFALGTTTPRVVALSGKDPSSLFALISSPPRVGMSASLSFSTSCGIGTIAGHHERCHIQHNCTPISAPPHSIPPLPPYSGEENEILRDPKNEIAVIQQFGGVHERIVLPRIPKIELISPSMCPIKTMSLRGTHLYSGLKSLAWKGRIDGEGLQEDGFVDSVVNCKRSHRIHFAV